MIHLERPAPPPQWSDRAEPAQHAVSKTHVQSRYAFDEELVHDESVFAGLRSVNGRRCAFCESEENDPSPVSIERFRPQEEATDLDGTPHREHYFWLAFAWDNLLPVCGSCSSARGRRFPVAGRRAPLKATGAQLGRERRLLLDPFADDPELELGYDAGGVVVGLTERANITIGLLNLNRPSLLVARQAAAAEVEDQIAMPGLATNSDLSLDMLESSFHAQVGGTLAFTGARRYAVRVALRDRGLARRLYGGNVEVAEAARRLHVGGKAFTEMIAHRHRVEIRPEGPHPPSELGAVRLETIELADMKPIEHLRIDLQPPTPDREPWLVLLGENGVGKSTVLKAIALAAMTATERRRWAPDASSWVRRDRHVRSGVARLSFTDGQVLELTAHSGSDEFTVTGSAPAQVLLGYGPTRLPPDREHAPSSGAGLHIDNLFDPWVPLDDVEGWLSDTTRVPADEFNLHSTDLRALLPMDPDDLLVRRSGRLYARENGRTVPLAALSDGFRSVIALATDMMLHLSRDSPSMLTAAGTVLIDELEVHLHPQWKLTIVGLLRRVFPQVRFIVSTHDPLCLQATEPGEVYLLRRDDDNRIDIRRTDVPKGLRADQLLTGHWFGLATTVDDETSTLIATHGQLLLREQTPEVRAEREALEEQIRGRLGHFAETAPERMAQSIAAELAQGREMRRLSADERAALRSSVLAAMKGREAGATT
jgi:hypothetical protein